MYHLCMHPSFVRLRKELALKNPQHVSRVTTKEDFSINKLCSRL